MIKSTTIRSGFHAGTFFAPLLSALCLAAAVPAAHAGVQPSLTDTPAQPDINLSSIAAEDKAAASAPFLASGAHVQYFCDCQKGNAKQPQTGCVAGDDTAGRGTARSPYRTLGKAVAWLNKQTSGVHTVALCQGGVWNAPDPAAGRSFSLMLTANTYCPPGRTCSEIREYRAPWGSNAAKPIIYNSAAPASYLFSLGNGQRIMNLSLFGSGNASSSQVGVFLYRFDATGPHTGRHDDTLWNVDMDGFDIAVQDAQPFNYNMTIKGNHISNSTVQAFLGESSNLKVEYNYFHNNGSSTPTDHTLYFGGNYPVHGVNVIGNYIDGFWRGGKATSCNGGMLTIHGEFSNLVVSGNTLIQDPEKSSVNCWGISATNGNYNVGTYIRKALFSDNVVLNAGNAGIVVDNAPHAVIENNLVIQDSRNGGLGIGVASQGQRTLTATGNPKCNSTAVALGATCSDDPSTSDTIRNNTIYFSANSNQGMKGGILVGNAGSAEMQTGHAIYNNTVSYAATTHGLNRVSCFNYPLPLSAYATVNNNNCYSADASYAWEGTTGPAPAFRVKAHSLASWISHASGQGYGFDNANPATVTANPGFTLAAYPYLTWSDSSHGYLAFNSGGNRFAATAPLLGKGVSGPARDITGAARPNPPAIGAYQ